MNISKLIGWVKRNQILSFIILTFFFSYLLGLPFLIFTGSLSTGSTEFTKTYLPRLLIVIGPALAAIGVSYILKRSAGVKELLQKLRPRRKHWTWFLSLPSLAIVVTFSAFLLSGLPPGDLAEIFGNSWYFLLGHLLVQILLIGIGEELGWRGWLLPKLTERYSLGGSVFFVTIIWGLWHFPILFKEASILLPWLLLLVSVSIIFTWIWLKVKGNIAVLAVAHGSINSVQFFLEEQLRIERSQLLLDSWQMNAWLYFAVALGFLFLMRKSIFRKTFLNVD